MKRCALPSTRVGKQQRPSYDGSNYSAWMEALFRDFTIRRAKWILFGRLAGDDELNEIALSVLQGSLSTQIKYLLDGSTCVKTAFESICNHADSQMKARVTLLKKDLSNLSQGSMTAREFFEKVNETHTNFIRAGGTRYSDKDLIDLIVLGLGSQFISVQ
jgi:hypothetical protein